MDYILICVVENKNDEKFRMQEKINNTRKVCKLYVCGAMNYMKLFIKLIKNRYVNMYATS